MRQRLSVCLTVGLLLIGASALQAQSQTCIDNAVIACFDGCNDPNNFQECIIGCATGANGNPQNCRDQCYDDPICMEKCMRSIRAISTCEFAQGNLKAACGTPVLNRATGFWQQTVKVTNVTPSTTMRNTGYVLDSLAAGWKLLNGDGVTADLLPAASPYKNLGELAPGASATFVLQFSRTGTLALGYINRVVTSEGR